MVQREKEINTRNPQNHTISCLYLFMCFCFKPQKDRR